MAKFKRPKIGDILVLPIGSEYSVGLVTRVNSENIPLGYFYGKLFPSFPISIEDLKIDFKNPILIIEFGSQGLKNGSWQILDNYSNFKIEDFPVPVFYINTKPFKPQLVYFDDNMNEVNRKTVEENEILESYPEIGLGGSGYIEKKIAKILANQNS